MSSIRILMTTKPINYLRFVYNIVRLQTYSTTQLTENIDVVDVFTKEVIDRFRDKRKQLKPAGESLNYFSEVQKTDLSQSELDDLIREFMLKNRDKKIEEIVSDCHDNRKFISEASLKKLFRHYSMAGKPEMVSLLQNYCAKVDPNLYKRNVEFLHYLAEAHCLKGNSERGLSILTHCYRKFEGRRSFYRLLFRELIQDSVLNRSEASLVIFKNYALQFSNQWNDHYPLVCFWYICWSSNWFSNQLLSDELLKASQSLQEIVQDKAPAFSMTILRDYNEDAVVRLLQSLLKYNMMEEYAKVLQIFFTYKLRTKDIRGCREIIRNCEVLNITLPSDLQGKFIKMLIWSEEKSTNDSDKKITSKSFDLKF